MPMYYVEMAARSLKRDKVLASLVVLAIGLGIGASMSMVSVLHALSADPLPGRSEQLFYPHLDPGPAGFSEATGVDPGKDFTWVDANNLIQAHQATRQAALVEGDVLVRPGGERLKPFRAEGHYVSSEFFSMFGATFREGAGWNPSDDAQHAHTVVLNGALARKLFGAAAATGKIVNLEGLSFRVAGVLDDWRPRPLFYASSGGGALDGADEFFLPLATAMDQPSMIGGSMTCWGSGDRTGDQCSWLQLWVQLPDSAARMRYRDFLHSYALDQRSRGRSLRVVDGGLLDMPGRLDQLRLVPGEIKLQLWLALGFLGVCMFNTVGLLMAKYLGRSAEVSVRRAMGARRHQIFLQFACESAVIGVAGGVLGLALAQLGLFAIRLRPDGYAQLARMDPAMLGLTLALSVLAALASGLLPAWRACQVEPALNLKVQ